MSANLPVPRREEYETAKKAPRDASGAIAQAMTMATASPAAARLCVSTVPRGGKQIDCPSVRLAEILAQTWGNLRIDARLVEIGHEDVTVEAAAHDLETNTAIRIEVHRLTVDRDGRPFPRHLVDTAIKAALAIAKRDATLQIIPRVLWDPIFQECRKARGGPAAGPPQGPEREDGPDVPDKCSERRECPSRPSPSTSRQVAPTPTNSSNPGPEGTPVAKALAWWGGRGVPESVILRQLGRGAAAEVSGEDLTKLREWARLILDEAATVEGIFDIRQRRG